MSTIVYVTVCTEKRNPILANALTHGIIVNSWQLSTNWLVGRYVIMPDHIHLFCAPDCYYSYPLARWIAYWKSMVTRNLMIKNMLWQKSFWDRTLRCVESYSAKWDYVRSNPIRAGLCQNVEEWPYQGELNILPWHD